jgi:hypothetical protein
MTQSDSQACKMKLFNYFLLFISISSAFSLNQRFFMQSTKCSEDLVTMINLKENYFKAEYSVMFVDLNSEKIDIDTSCAIDVYQPMEISNDKNQNLKFPTASSSPNAAYPTTKGFFVRGNYEKVLKFVEEMSKFNTQLKVLVYLMDMKEKQIESLMKIGFEKNKMLNVAVMTFTDNHHTLCMRNPFTDKARKLKCWNLKSRDNYTEKLNNFIKSRIYNLQKYKLNIELFEQTVVSMPVRDKNGNVLRLKYADGELLNVLAEKMNFTPNFVFSPDRAGHLLSNGTWTGSFGLVEDDKQLISYSVLSKTIMEYKTKKSLSLHRSSTNEFRFVIRKSSDQNKFDFSKFFKFDVISTYCIVCLLALFPISLVIVNKLESKFMKKKPKSVSDIFTMVTGMILSISRKMPKLNSTRLIILTILYFNIIFAAIFQSSMTTNFNTDSDEKILTMKELLEKGYELKIPLSLKSIFQEQSGSETNEILKKFALKENEMSEIKTVEEAFDYMATHKNTKMAVLAINVYTTGFLKIYLDPETGEDMMEVIPEKVHEFYIAPMTRKDSPFIEVFNKYISEYLESGIREIEMRRVIDEMTVAKIQKFKEKSERKLIKLKNLVSLIKVYVGMAILSVLMFLCEVFWRRIIKKLRE